MFKDLRYSVRVLLKHPGFTFIAILSLALGIGANTAIFSLFSALYLKSLPGERPHELVSVYTSDFSGPLYATSSYTDYIDMRDRNETLSGLVCYTPFPSTLTQGENTERVYGEFVSGNYFSVLGIPIQLGRGFAPDEDVTPGTHPVVVLSAAMWQNLLGRDSTIVGRKINLGGNPFTVIGVAADGFTGMFRGFGAQFWVPTMSLNLLQRDSNDLTHRGSRSLFLLGRLRPSTTVEQAQANFKVIGAQLAETHGPLWVDINNQRRAISVLPESQSRIFPLLSTPLLGFIAFLLVAVSIVLLIACSNLANLLLARSAARRKEIAVRFSLGATRKRLIRQLLTESMLLSLLAGVAGVAVAIGIRRAFSLFEPPIPIPIALDAGIDLPVLLFTVVASLLTGLLFGLAPALQSTRSDLAESIKDDAGAGGYRRSRLRSSLVVAQVALSILFLIGSGLFVRSLANASTIDPGFDPNNLLLLSVDLGPQGYEDGAQRAFFVNALERLRSLPNVQSASYAENIDLGIAQQRRGILAQGYAYQPNENTEVDFNRVGPGFFETMRIPLVRGRSFNEADREGAPPVIVVNEAFARRYWPAEDAVGKRVSSSGTDGPWMEVIGVAKDGKYRSLGEDSTPFVYLPQFQDHRAAATFVLRTNDNPMSLQSAAKAEFASLDRALPVFDVKSGIDHLRFALLPAQLAGAMLGVFGLLALVLAAIGIYGVMSYSAVQRTREIGIRVALGAKRTEVLLLVVGQGMRLAFIGMVIGLVAALAVTRFASSFLYGISPTDPITFIGIALLLSLIAFLACYIPAKRASRVDPMVALRYE